MTTSDTLMAKLEQIEGCAFALWVHRVELYGCIYGEKLDFTTVFAFFSGCISTRYLYYSFAHPCPCLACHHHY